MNYCAITHRHVILYSSCVLMILFYNSIFVEGKEILFFLLFKHCIFFCMYILYIVRLDEFQMVFLLKKKIANVYHKGALTALYDLLKNIISSFL